jgi:hypothetical protein
MREEARRLRIEGWRRADICRVLGIKDSSTFANWIKDLPVPPGVRTRRIDPALKEKALLLRSEGRSYRDIQEVTGVSRSTLSEWLKNVPITDEHRAALKDLQRSASQRRGDAQRARRIARQSHTRDQARDGFGPRTDRDLFVAGVAVYWAEGAKRKPWREGSDRVSFINSDSQMIRLFVDWLRLLGIGTDQLVFRLQIHEGADIDRATEFWARTVQVPESEFRRPTLKRHNPTSSRKNQGDSFFGCLRIDVRRSSELYRRIEGSQREPGGPVSRPFGPP